MTAERLCVRRAAVSVAVQDSCLYVVALCQRPLEEIQDNGNDGSSLDDQSPLMLVEFAEKPNDPVLLCVFCVLIRLSAASDYN